LSRPDGGTILPMVPILLLAFFLLGGLIIDGSRDLNGRAEATAFAEEAARAGAGQVDLSQDQLTLLPDARVRAAIDSFCATVRDQVGSDRVATCAEAPGSPAAPDGAPVGAAPIVVRVAVTLRVRTTFLGLFGLHELRVTGLGSAQPTQGESGPDG
jgi:hypothetical protein